MDSDTVSKISAQVFSRYPEVRGARPKVQPQGVAGNVLLVYKASAKAADGSTIDRVVRVVASETGKIIKMSTSK